MSKLKTCPNRSTRFINALRKKLSIIKVSALTIDTLEFSADRKLYPTFGLLMTHLINITLVSSKMT